MPRITKRNSIITGTNRVALYRFESLENPPQMPDNVVVDVLVNVDATGTFWFSDDKIKDEFMVCDLYSDLLVLI